MQTKALEAQRQGGFGANPNGNGIGSGYGKNVFAGIGKKSAPSKTQMKRSEPEMTNKPNDGAATHPYRSRAPNTFGIHQVYREEANEASGRRAKIQE
jgi:hypothetical protein